MVDSHSHQHTPDHLEKQQLKTHAEACCISDGVELQDNAAQCLGNVGADAHERVENWSLLGRRDVIGEAPKQQTETHISPHLSQAIEKRERPIAHHTDGTVQSTR